MLKPYKWSDIQKYIQDDSTKAEFVCNGLWGIGHGTYYNWKNQLKEEGSTIDHRTDREDFVPANKLSEQEIQMIKDRYEQLVAQGFSRITGLMIAMSFLDEGDYVCSASTIDRYIREYKLTNGSVADAQIADDSLTKKRVSCGVKPEGTAYGPNQVWVADTTYVTTDIKGKYYYLQTIMDLYSRKIVFWEIYDHENANGWKECLEKALLKENIQDASSIQFHTDNGSAYRASTFQAFLESNHIKYTHNRPLVSNDNCYMESFYATLKKSDRVDLRPFCSLDEARKCIGVFMDYYNNEHHHSGINYLTPVDVHNGKEQEIIDTRNKLKEMAKEKHPERFARFKKEEVQESVSLTRVNTLLTKEQNYALYKNYKNN